MVYKGTTVYLVNLKTKTMSKYLQEDQEPQFLGKIVKKLLRVHPSAFLLVSVPGTQFPNPVSVRQMMSLHTCPESAVML